MWLLLPASGFAGTLDFKIVPAGETLIRVEQAGNDTAYRATIYSLTAGWNWLQLSPSGASRNNISPVWPPGIRHHYVLPDADKNQRPLLIVFHDKSGITFSKLIRLTGTDPAWPDGLQAKRRDSGDLVVSGSLPTFPSGLRYGLLQPVDSALAALKTTFTANRPPIAPLLVTTGATTLKTKPMNNLWFYCEWQNATNQEKSELQWATLFFPGTKESIMGGIPYWLSPRIWFSLGGASLAAALAITIMTLLKNRPAHPSSPMTERNG